MRTIWRRGWCGALAVGWSVVTAASATAACSAQVVGGPTSDGVSLSAASLHIGFQFAGCSPVDVGFVFWRATVPEPSTGTPGADSGAVQFAAQDHAYTRNAVLQGLQPATTYYFRAYFRNAAGAVFLKSGTSALRTTDPPPNPPPVVIAPPAITTPTLADTIVHLSRGVWSGDTAVVDCEYHVDDVVVAAGCADIDASAWPGRTISYLEVRAGPGGSTTATSNVVQAPPVPTVVTSSAASGAVVNGGTILGLPGSFANATSVWAGWFRDGQRVADTVAYRLSDADAGHTLQFVTDAANPYVGGRASSAATPIAVGPIPQLTAAPAITGVGTAGARLVATPGSWAPADGLTFSYGWRRCALDGDGCVDLPGAGDASYTVDRADVGSSLRAVVHAASSFDSRSAVSPTLAVGRPQSAPQPPADPTRGPQVRGPAIAGRQEVGRAGVGWSGDEPLTPTFQWRSCAAAGGDCAEIAGASGSTLVPGDRLVGRTLVLHVEMSNAFGHAGADSPPTPPIAARSTPGRIVPGVGCHLTAALVDCPAQSLDARGQVVAGPTGVIARATVDGDAVELRSRVSSGWTTAAGRAVVIAGRVAVGGELHRPTRITVALTPLIPGHGTLARHVTVSVTAGGRFHATLRATLNAMLRVETEPTGTLPALRLAAGRLGVHARILGVRFVARLAGRRDRIRAVAVSGRLVPAVAGVRLGWLARRAGAGAIARPVCSPVEAPIVRADGRFHGICHGLGARSLRWALAYAPDAATGPLLQPGHTGFAAVRVVR